MTEMATVLEARRTMEICNACRYCEGYCAVFPAMTRRRAFPLADLEHLANLCHNCKGCYFACQYAPPHEFGLNLPNVFSELRAETYEKYAWPGFFARAYRRNGFVTMIVTAFILIAAVVGVSIAIKPVGMINAYKDEASFYAVIPHETMIVVFGLSFGFAVLAMVVGLVRYWRGIGGGVPDLSSVITGLKAAATLKHLGGGGAGCNDLDEGFSNQRRLYHHFTMWGFLLCFAATALATVYHYAFGLQAPYDLPHPVKVLGVIGGIGLLIGPVGLFAIKYRTDRTPEAVSRHGTDIAFLASLFLVSLTGLALYLLRDTSAMGPMLIVHLAFVFAFFLMMPYGKFVHGLYRSAALVRDRQEGRDAI